MSQESVLPRFRAFSDACLLTTAVILMAALLFPPYHLAVGNGVETNLGFGWLFSPPQYGHLVGVVNIPLLCVELIVTAAIGALAWLWALSGGDAYFDELSPLWRQMSRSERQAIAEVLTYSIHRKVHLEESELRQFGFTDLQVKYAARFEAVRQVKAELRSLAAERRT